MSLILLRRRGLDRPPDPVQPGPDDPTYAQRMVTINPGENWQTKINSQPAGTLNNPIIFGITQGIHPRAAALGARPKSYHWFVGESDGVPTSKFPNGSPISVIQGGRFTAPGNDFFLAENSTTPTTGVKVVMLEIDGFSSPSGVYYFMGGSTVNWYFSHVHQHHAGDSGWRMGEGTYVRHCWIHHNGRDGMTANSWWKGSRLQNIVIEYTTVEYCNTLGYAPNVSGSHAGGSKFLSTDGMIIRYCDWSRNGGPGLWWDGGNTGTHVHNNIVYDNILGTREGSGIFYEINDATTGALFEYNDCRRNGDAANIHLSNSRGSASAPIIVRNNYTEEHPQWEIIHQNSGARPPQADHTLYENNTCKRTINSSKPAKHLVGIHTLSGAPPANQLNIRFENNHYIWDPGNLGHSVPFLYNTGGVSWANWNSLGYDDTGTYQEV